MSNYFQQQPNAGLPNGNPTLQQYYEYGQQGAPPSNNPLPHPSQQVAQSYASIGGTQSNSSNAYSYRAVAGQQIAGGAVQYNIMGHPNQQAPSYASLSGYRSSMNGEQGAQMYAMNNYTSMPIDSQMQVNGAGNGFEYSSLGAQAQLAGNPQPEHQMNRWNPQQQQQQQQQQHQQQQYHQEQYINHQYAQNQMAPGFPSYDHLHPSYRPNTELKESRPPLPAAEQLPPLPPPPPHPPPTEYHNTSNVQKINPGGGNASDPGEEQAPKAATASGGKCNLKKKPSSKGPIPSVPIAAVQSNDTNDNAVDAINALSILQSRWSAPAAGNPLENQSRWSAPSKQSQMEKNMKRRKRKRSKKKKDGNSDDDNGIVIVEEALLKNIGVWIDVEDGSLAKRKQPPKDDEFSLDSNKFPSLASQSQGGDNDAQRLASLKGVPTSQLASYAAVLGGALEKKDTAKRALKNALMGGEDEEMDISEEEEEVDNSKSGQVTQSIPAPRPDTVPPSVYQRSETNDKEKRALKLAELRAKAKLARAKLRIAEQKKARGNAAAAMESLDSNKKEPRLSGLQHGAPPASPLSTKPQLADITALREIGNLVIEDVGATGPDNEVRYVHSVYDRQGFEENYPIQDSNDIKSAQISTGDNNAPIATTPTEENRKKSESLKQKLHLARLRLQIKKKVLERKGLEQKKRKELAAVELESKESPVLSVGVHLAPKEGLTVLNQGNGAQLKEHVVDGGGITTADLSSDSAVPIAGQRMSGQGQPATKQGNEEVIDNAPNAKKQAQAKLEQLRSRQKELKQKNDIANLRNLIHRQRDMLQAQCQELTDSSTQLQSCADSMKSKQLLFDEADHKVEEMNRRKRIVEGMVFRATEQLITARKALSEKRNQNLR